MRTGMTPATKRRIQTSETLAKFLRLKTIRKLAATPWKLTPAKPSSQWRRQPLHPPSLRLQYPPQTEPSSMAQ
jgi:hypothetical protein